FGGSANSFYQAAPGGGADAQLARQYVKAQKEEEKRELRKKLTELLGKEFDDHAKYQQQELEQLEKHEADLKVLLPKHMETRSRRSERRREQLSQEAEGLGWNVPGRQRSGFGGSFGRSGFGAPGGAGFGGTPPEKK